MSAKSCTLCKSSEASRMMPVCMQCYAPYTFQGDELVRMSAAQAQSVAKSHAGNRLITLLTAMKQQVLISAQNGITNTVLTLTGSHTLEEVGKALDVLKKDGFVVMHWQGNTIQLGWDESEGQKTKEDEENQ